MNGEIIIIMCEISHTPKCTEWMANWRDLPSVLSAILGGLAPLLFHFLRSDRRNEAEEEKNLNLFYFSLLLHWRCWKVMNCDEISYCSNEKKSQCFATPFQLFSQLPIWTRKEVSKLRSLPETVKGCWLLLFGLFFGCFCCRSNGDRFKADNFRHNWLLVGLSDFL